MEKVSAVYKIINTITGDFYIGSSKDIKERWKCHKKPSTWKNNPNKQLYKDMQKYGTDKFELQILEEVEIDYLKEEEQKFIEKLKPTYNNYRAKGLDIERQKKYHKEYYKEYFHNNEKYKKYQKKYDNQLCYYNNEKLTLCALASRFTRAGIEHPKKEAKKYIMN